MLSPLKETSGNDLEMQRHPLVFADGGGDGEDGNERGRSLVFHVRY